MSHPEQVKEKSAKPAKRMVQILVNNRKVEVEPRASGSAIKAAARVPTDFDLFKVEKGREVPVADDEIVKVKKGDVFVASPTLDPSFPVATQFDSAIDSVRDAFPDHSVSFEPSPDGSVMVSVADVEIGNGWNHHKVDLGVKLQVTFPSTPPYPFYGPEGLSRTDGLNPSAIQPLVSVDCRNYAQISLNKPFDETIETLGGRFLAVVHWLRNPK